ncbi:hypothetical protein XSR1_350029 [Xenorhabdus szentirmaii DSM 16338]|uniref:Uncharacterized protein n=1 Tax=Xenorhabdus szentirmaii DSM 16338 TaxID=1427518 RepID=W1IZ01_9GAMM|nr:hypothetical protein XSR1_350029 [Xenorhabdus szentirmaii DSM 16338]
MALNHPVDFKLQILSGRVTVRKHNSGYIGMCDYVAGGFSMANKSAI